MPLVNVVGPTPSRIYVKAQKRQNVNDVNLL
jgi:hypothetical protein